MNEDMGDMKFTTAGDIVKEDIVERLLEDQPDDRQCHREARIDLYNILTEAAAEIERLRKTNQEIALQALVDQTQATENWEEVQRLREKCNKLSAILQKLKPENFPGVYFICGESGEKDTNGLPEQIMVVPSYGCDWHMVYKRSDKTFGPEW
jgi:hypothetical protein